MTGSTAGLAGCESSTKKPTDFAAVEDCQTAERRCERSELRRETTLRYSMQSVWSVFVSNRPHEARK